jgi:hypothetical protein
MRKPEMHESAPNIVFHESLLRDLKNAFDKTGSCFIIIKRQLIAHPLLESAKNTEIKTLKGVRSVMGKSYHLNAIIGKFLDFCRSVVQ